jgi:hypothetical protein
LIFGDLALAHGRLLFQLPFLLVVGLAMLGGLVVLCKVYFLVGLSQASAFLWPAMWSALRYRGPNNALMIQTANGDAGRFFQPRLAPISGVLGGWPIRNSNLVNRVFRGGIRLNPVAD